ncbi:MAG: aminotransferase class I/II-fold pyridoxal phosphate-dependent enzyme [Bryobacteraceae bacterium]
MGTDPINHQLDFSSDEMRAMGYRVIDLLVEQMDAARTRPVGHKAKLAEIRAALREPVPPAGSSFDAVLDQIQRDVIPNRLNLTHPRFFAFVPGPSNYVSVLGDALASGLNVFNGSWLGGSAAAAMELQTIDWLRGLCGFPETAGGLFVSGGSVANLTALAVARDTKLSGDLRGARVYFSDQTHSSIEKALRVVGFLPEHIVKIASDPSFRLPVQALAERISADKAAGLRPFCVIANGGTTNTGAVDPLIDVAAVARREDLWMHVDGAYGAAAVICERGKRILEGMEFADSLSLDPHKWLFQPIECGCILLRDAERLRDAYRILPDYLKDIHRNEQEVNPCDYGIQLTRGFRALKVWMSVKVFGIDAFRAAVDRGFALAEHTQRCLERMPGWEVVAGANMAMLSFRYGSEDAVQTALMEEMLADGFAILSTTILRGRTVLRMCTINPRTTEADIEETLARLDAMAKRLA